MARFNLKQRLKQLGKSNQVKFVSGIFAGKTGTVQATLPSGRLLVKINGTGPGPNGRPTRLGSTMADPSEVAPV